MLALNGGATSTAKTGAIAFLPQLLEGFRPPTGSFDPESAWESSYRLFIIGHLSAPYREWQRVAAGALRLRREPLTGGRFRLRVSFTAAQGIHGGGSIDRVEAELICTSDRFATLRSWRRRVLCLAPDGAPVGGMDMRESGRVTKGVLIRRTARERTRRVSLPLTCNWAIFEALQRLPAETKEALRFAMLEELEFLRPNQCLRRGEPLEVETGGHSVRWLRFEQFGEGVLPWTYCLDEQHRVVAAFTVMRAYVYDPTATVGEIQL